MVLTVADLELWTAQPVSGHRRAHRIVIALLLAALALLLFARIMAAPVRHDEQMFVSIGALFGQGDIYRDFGFNHLPNLAILLGAVNALFAVDQPFLAGRLLVAGGWLGAAAALYAIGWRATRSHAVAALAVLLLATNPLLVGAAGTLVTNNFLPLALALGGLHVYIAAVDRPQPHVALTLLAGGLLAVAIGLKANYILLIPPFALAALLAPRALPFTTRLRRIMLPLLLGGVIGALPTLWYFAADPDGFAAHVVGYHRGPHLAWSALSQTSLVRSFADRLQLAQSLWFSGGTMIIIVALAALLFQLGWRRWRPRWPAALAAGLVLTAVIVSFVPTPAFAQYYAPPIGFMIALLALLLGELRPLEYRAARPLLAAVALLAVVVDGPRLVRDAAALARPSRWTGNTVHAVAEQVAAAANGRPVATLTPIYALDAGASIYPELAAGPFVYRVADLIPPRDRRHYRLVSPATLAARLDAQPPGAILVGAEGDLDDGLRAYARTRGYVRAPLNRAATRYGALELYVPAGNATSQPPPNRAATTSTPSSPSL